MADTDATVTRNDQTHRYEARVDGVVAGFAAYLESDTHVAFTHTEVDDAFQGRGVSSVLAATALADAVERGKTIIPLCPFMARYLRRHEIPGAVIEWPNRDGDS